MVNNFACTMMTMTIMNHQELTPSTAYLYVPSILRSAIHDFKWFMIHSVGKLTHPDEHISHTYHSTCRLSRVLNRHPHYTPRPLDTSPPDREASQNRLLPLTASSPGHSPFSSLCVLVSLLFSPPVKHVRM